MPWDAKSVMDEKVKFVAECLAGAVPMTVLCEKYEISRETGYVWKRRYDAEGVRGLEERSRAPRHHGDATPAALVMRLIELRRAKPFWGPKKLLRILSDAEPSLAWPAASTCRSCFGARG